MKEIPRILEVLVLLCPLSIQSCADWLYWGVLWGWPSLDVLCYALADLSSIPTLALVFLFLMTFPQLLLGRLLLGMFWRSHSRLSGLKVVLSICFKLDSAADIYTLLCILSFIICQTRLEDLLSPAYHMTFHDKEHCNYYLCLCFSTSNYRFSIASFLLPFLDPKLLWAALGTATLVADFLFSE